MSWTCQRPRAAPDDRERGDDASRRGPGGTAQSHLGARPLAPGSGHPDDQGSPACADAPGQDRCPAPPRGLDRRAAADERQLGATEHDGGGHLRLLARTRRNPRGRVGVDAQGVGARPGARDADAKRPGAGRRERCDHRRAAPGASRDATPVGREDREPTGRAGGGRQRHLQALATRGRVGPLVGAPEHAGDLDADREVAALADAVRIVDRRQPALLDQIGEGRLLLGASNRAEDPARGDDRLLHDTGGRRLGLVWLRPQGVRPEPSRGRAEETDRDPDAQRAGGPDRLGERIRVGILAVGQDDDPGFARGDPALAERGGRRADPGGDVRSAGGVRGPDRAGGAIRVARRIGHASRRVEVDDGETVGFGSRGLGRADQVGRHRQGRLDPEVPRIGGAVRAGRVEDERDRAPLAVTDRIVAHDRADHERPARASVPGDQRLAEGRPLVGGVGGGDADRTAEVAVDLPARCRARALEDRVDRALVLVEIAVLDAVEPPEEPVVAVLRLRLSEQPGDREDHRSAAEAPADQPRRERGAPAEVDVLGGRRSGEAGGVPRADQALAGAVGPVRVRVEVLRRVEHQCPSTRARCTSPCRRCPRRRRNRARPGRPGCAPGRRAMRRHGRWPHGGSPPCASGRPRAPSAPSPCSGGSRGRRGGRRRRSGTRRPR